MIGSMVLNRTAVDLSRGDIFRFARRRAGLPTSDAVVHRELDRVRSVFEAVDLLPFEVDVAVDQVVGEHIALLEKVTVGVELGHRLAQAVAHGGHVLERGGGRAGLPTSDAVVHRELDRVRSVFEAVDLLPFEVDVAVDQVVGERNERCHPGGIIPLSL